MENNNKRTLILSIIGILVLVLAVVGVSFAMFTFTGTGTKENVIKTGSISVKFDDSTKNNKIELSNQYPESDAKGMADTTNETTFTVEGDWGSSPMTVNYEVGLSEVTQGATLTNDYVKVAIQKNDSYVKGSATGGVAVSTFASANGPLGYITGYYVTNGTLTNGDLKDTFKVKAYVSEDYNLPDDATKSTAPEVTGGTVNNQSGAHHQKTSKSETYSFKVKVVAQQV